MKTQKYDDTETKPCGHQGFETMPDGSCAVADCDRLFIPKKYTHYKGWTLDGDPIGTIYYHKNSVSIYCTPNWDGTDGLSLDIYDYNKDVEVSLDVTTEKITNAKQWFSFVKPILDGDVTGPLVPIYTAYLKKEGLEHLGSADEAALDEDITEEQREWLKDFVERWDEVMKAQHSVWDANDETCQSLKAPKGNE